MKNGAKFIPLVALAAISMCILLAGALFFVVIFETPSQDLDETRNVDFIFDHIESMTFEYLNLTDGKVYSFTERVLWDVEITFEYGHDEFGVMGFWDSRNPLDIEVVTFEINWITTSDFNPIQIGKTAIFYFYDDLSGYYFQFIKNWYRNS